MLGSGNVEFGGHPREEENYERSKLKKTSLKGCFRPKKCSCGLKYFEKLLLKILISPNVCFKKQLFK